MRSISKQQYFIVKVPWITTDGHQCRGWIFKKIFCQCRHIGQSIRECLFKKCNDLFFSIQTFERSSPFIGKKSVTVKLPSKFGKAININSPRGHICKQFLSKQCVPSGLAGKLNSLYPCGRYSCA